MYCGACGQKARPGNRHCTACESALQTEDPSAPEEGQQIALLEQFGGREGIGLLFLDEHEFLRWLGLTDAEIAVYDDSIEMRKQMT